MGELMLERKIEGMESEMVGISLLMDNMYDEAISYFRELPEQNFLSLYGLATALFRKKTFRLNREEVDEILLLYSQSIALNPDFADAFLMSGMAFEALASTHSLVIRNKNNNTINIS
jgi:tetratricopeptide (TPR) repeat protein